ncbi:hypothetical protein BHE74_00005115 [Ensete ventricosum]|uniref:Uncharacterized protein n=1 Tax=Ensete ventricosum TaxID=4639 RepID=A0A445MCS5_ENSVE|nr:hypothetical protein BHE74_00005115 [Ensete ventricosum]RZR72023.1 hypothetical protein BHM03_00009755 [Ensete ventricosum]
MLWQRQNRGPSPHPRRSQEAPPRKHRCPWLHPFYIAGNQRSGPRSSKTKRKRISSTENSPSRPETADWGLKGGWKRVCKKKIKNETARVCRVPRGGRGERGERRQEERDITAGEG